VIGGWYQGDARRVGGTETAKPGRESNFRLEVGARSFSLLAEVASGDGPMKLDRRLFAGGAVALGATLLAGRALGATNGAPSTTGEWPELFKVLRAAGPLIVAGEDPQARLFDRLAGAWDIDYTTINDDGSRQKTRGQLLVAWVLDGRALQDIWLVFPKPGEDRFIGTTLRFYDPARKTWRITWVSPIAQAVTLLEGGDESGRIVLHGRGPKGRLRWTFSDITDEDFAWRGELSTDGGTTWRLREDHRMLRMPIA
jgi:hypothetical protein